MADSPIRVMLVEDHRALLRALAFVFAREPDLTVVAQAECLAEARKHLDAGLAVDVVVVDLELPDGSGVDLIHGVCTANRSAHALVLSGRINDRARAFAIEAGASWLIDKAHADPDEIVVAIRRVHAGEALIAPADAAAIMADAARFREGEQAARAALARLTRREREILQAIAEGLGDRAIAERLYVSDRTVSNHVAAVLGKLGVDSRLQALLLAARLGVVSIH